MQDADGSSIEAGSPDGFDREDYESPETKRLRNQIQMNGRY